MQTSVPRDDRGGRGREAAAGLLPRMMRAVASRFKRRPDLSLANEKFTDALERELLGRAIRGGFQ